MLIQKALQTGTGPNNSEAYTINGLPRPLYNFSTKVYPNVIHITVKVKGASLTLCKRKKTSHGKSQIWHGPKEEVAGLLIIPVLVTRVNFYWEGLQNHTHVLNRVSDRLVDQRLHYTSPDMCVLCVLQGTRYYLMMNI
ncbi:hypothetical protein AQUCO_00600409v1 [Aquilegia coerulea]|uniref:Uncharacterized protein n=1 Tax=Aquilegia coerulea TaxID=218851 RepID=A0A2G5EPH8_AQUCA|nr:hypothetical protein AQUCO_00600409v1 [Aquilegia coerulea]